MLLAAAAASATATSEGSIGTSGSVAAGQPRVQVAVAAVSLAELARLPAALARFEQRMGYVPAEGATVDVAFS